MRFGLCTGPDGAQLAGKIGFDYVEPAVASLVPEKPDADFAPAVAAMAASKLKAEAFNCFIPANLKITGPAVDLDGLRKYVAVALPRAAKLGAAVVVFGSGGARRVPDGFPMEKALDQIAAFLNAIAPIAAAWKITIAIEPLHKGECNVINLVTDGFEMARRVNKPAIRSLADLYHIGQDHEPLANILTAAPTLSHVHIAHPITRKCPLPGDGYDYKTFFRALKDAKYDARISWECAFDDLEKQGPASLAYLRDEWQKA